MKKQSSRTIGKQRNHEKKTRLYVLETKELMTFLMEKMPDQSRNKIKSLLTFGQILVDGQVVKQYDHLLQQGQEVTVNWSLVRGHKEYEALSILYEDAELIVVEKPAGILTIGTDKEKERTLYHQLMNHVRRTNIKNRVYIVHRLDQDTSGLLLFAKNEEVKKLLQSRWRELIVERTYLALVEGQVRKREGTLKSWLLETKTKLMYSSSKPGAGSEAITRYKVLKSSAHGSFLEIHLETGRKNQIRVHMKDIGHSILGDRKYGAKTNPIGRMALHAHVLSFYHPVTKVLMRFETEIPAAFSQFMARQGYQP